MTTQFLPLYTLIENEGEEVPDLTIREDDSWFLHQPSSTLVIISQDCQWPVVIPLRNQEMIAMTFFTRGEQPQPFRDELGRALSRRYPKRKKMVSTVTRVRLIVAAVNRKVRPYGGYIQYLGEAKKYQLIRFDHLTPNSQSWEFRRESQRVFAVDAGNLIFLEMESEDGQMRTLKVGRGSPTQIIVLQKIINSPGGTTRAELLKAIEESELRIKKTLGTPLSREQHLRTVLNKLPTFLLENGFSFTIREESGGFTLARTT